jgi:hypothetical protein
MIIYYSSKDRRDILESFADYYLPLDSVGSGGMQYSYRSLSDRALAREVWQHIKTAEGLVTSINYDHRQQVVQKQYERIVANGVLIDSLILYDHDSLGNVDPYPVRVFSPHRFPFNVVDSTQVFLTHLEWWQPGDSLHIVLQRRRRFLGDTTWQWKGETIPAVRFHTDDQLETEEVGWTTSAWRGEEIYAAKIGLVYYRREISKHLVIEFELEAIEKMKK